MIPTGILLYNLSIIFLFVIILNISLFSAAKLFGDNSILIIGILIDTFCLAGLVAIMLNKSFMSRLVMLLF